MKIVSCSIAAMLLASTFSIAEAQQAAGVDADVSQEASIPRPVVVDPVKKDPAVVAEKVTAALKEAPGVPAKDIAVSSHAGTIVLTGEVSSEVENVRAKTVAEGAADGARVNNAIEVRAPEDRPSAQQQSAQLVRDVQQALKSDRQTANLGVTVTSEAEGVVVLQGLLPSAENRSAVQAVALRVAGVKRIDNRTVIPGQ